MTETDKRVSDQLVRLIQIIFGFVLAQSLSRYDSVVLRPLDSQNRLAAFALFTVYLTTVLSWIDWHITMAIRPYNLNPLAGRRLLEQLRVFSDLFVVTIYTFLLLAVSEFSSGDASDIHLYLWGFVFVFFGYAMSGLLRRTSYGKLASRLRLILLFFTIYVALVLSYINLKRHTELSLSILNYVAIGAALMIMLSYRLTRRVIRARARSMKESGLRIGFDVDGVLANQIDGVLPRVRRRLGVNLAYEDIIDWRLPIRQSDIASEIEFAMEDPDYVLNMPAHEGAQGVVNLLYPHHHIKVITARPAAAEQWTRVWLDKHGITVDSLSSVTEQGKSLFATDVLIDDYIGNMDEYLRMTNGIGILVDQPWNQKRGCLTTYFEEGRLHVVGTLAEIPALIERIARPAAPTPAPAPPWRR